jgi:serine/threonine protein kinase
MDILHYSFLTRHKKQYYEKYKKDQLIAGGQYGHVYTYEEDENKIIKLLNEGFSGRRERVDDLIKESVIHAQLDGTSVMPKLYTIVLQPNSTIGLVMEKCPMTLETLLESNIDFCKIGIITSLVNIFSILHQNKICHLDIKLNNIGVIVSENDYKTRIIDFGQSMKVCHPYGNLQIDVESDLFDLPPAFCSVFRPPEIIFATDHRFKDNKSVEGQIRGCCSDAWAIGIVIFLIAIRTCPGFNIESFICTNRTYAMCFRLYYIIECPQTPPDWFLGDKKTWEKSYYNFHKKNDHVNKRLKYRKQIEDGQHGSVILNIIDLLLRWDYKQRPNMLQIKTILKMRTEYPRITKTPQMNFIYNKTLTLQSDALRETKNPWDLFFYHSHTFLDDAENKIIIENLQNTHHNNFFLLRKYLEEHSINTILI